MLIGRFDASSPGTVFCKQTATSTEQQFVLPRTDMHHRQLSVRVPPPISPPGLDGPRQQYLYRQTQDFVSDPRKDVMCPLPGTVFPVVNAVAVDDAISGSDDDSVATDNLPRRGRGRGHGRGRGRGTAAASKRSVVADDSTAGSSKRGKGRAQTK